MHPFLAAVGPSFRQGYQISSLQSVDIYPLMCHLLAVPPQPNNGTMTYARCLLSAETCWGVSAMVGLVVVVLLILSSIVLFMLIRNRQSSGPRAFQRLQIDDDDDDDDPLLE
nr:bis(5'-adenosyl)-triphosphatase enpp4-like [Monopterus albus]